MQKQRQLEEESTDAGSSASDCESTCSSMAGGNIAENGWESLDDWMVETRNAGSPMPAQVAVSPSPVPPPPPGLTLGAKRIARLHVAPPLSRRGGTPLEPIPGTPVTRKDAFAFTPSAGDIEGPASPRADGAECPPTPPLPPAHWIGNADRAVPVLTALPQRQRVRLGTLGTVGELAGHGTNPTPARPPSVATALSYDPQAPPISPKRRHRAAMLAKAREHALPLKVRLASCVPRPVGPLDPSLPVKKKAPFPELLRAGAAARLTTIDPTEPVSKRASGFLLEDPPQVALMSAVPR